MDPSSVMVQIVLDVDAPRQQSVFREWAQGFGLDMDTLKDEGYGAGVNIYRLALPAGPAAKIDLHLLAVGAEFEFL